MKTKCYNSGPISTLPYEVAVSNFHIADYIISYNIGLTPVNPMSRWTLPRRWPWALHMLKDLLLLITCRNIYFQAGWSSSRGARIEHCVAEWLGMNRYYEELVLSDIDEN